MSQPEAGEVSAVLIPVPALDPVLGEARHRFDPAAADGVPAHVTLLYPWLRPDRITDRELAALRGIVGATPPIAVTFARTNWFDHDLLWVGPEPDAPLVALLRAVVSHWPELPPYGEPAWRVEDLVPHVTVGHGTRTELAAVERAVSEKLPVRTVLDEVWVMQGVVGQAWTRRARLRMGAQLSAK